jgi:polysaccharide chain length determinant protein (PEP-CTERM system associated)
MQDLQQTLHQLLDYIRGIWIKKRFVLVTSWIICPIGFAYVAMLPDEYESEAVVFVDTRSKIQPLLRGLTIQTNPQQEIEMIAQTLLSRSNIEEIARQSDLDITVTTDAEYVELINDLSEDIRLRPTSNENMYTITYRHENAEKARTVVQETLDLFVEGSLGNNRRDSDTANRFLDEQIAEYESRLLESEQRLADFKRQYADVLPQQGNFYDNLTNMSQRLEDLQLSIRETEQQVSSLKNQLRPQADSNGDISVATRFDSRIDTLQERLDELRLRYTDLHPDVIETTELLGSLKNAREQEIASLTSSASGDDGNMNILTQEIRLEISRLESSIASMKVREKDFQSKISILRSKIDLVPQVEAELTALNRDYGIMQQKYEQLLTRRESAELSRRADVSSDDLQFRIIEPPLTPTEPTGPKRLIFYTLVVLVGFGSGIGLAFLFSQLSPVLVRAQQLHSLTSYPVLGSVSHLQYKEISHKNKIKLVIFFTLSGILLSMYLSLVGAELLNVNLVQRVF